MSGSIPKGKGSSSNHQFSGAKMLVSEKVFLVLRGGGWKKDDETLPVITHLFSKKFWLRCSHPSASEFIVHSAHPATAFEKWGTGITGARPLLGGWSSVSHEKNTRQKHVKQLPWVCLCVSKRLAIWKKHIPAKLNTRWFKSWPFNPILGGHLASERVT